MADPRRWLVPLLVAAAVIAPFLVFGEVGVSAFETQVGFALGLLALTLLTLDVVLPVPSSAILVLLGAELGALWGTMIGATGLTLGAIFGWTLGAGVSRVVPQTKHERRVEQLGWSSGLSVGLLRGVPVLAETSAILSGMRATRLSHIMRSVVPVSLLLAAASSYGGSIGREEHPGWLVALIVGIPLVAATPILIHEALHASRNRRQASVR